MDLRGWLCLRGQVRESDQGGGFPGHRGSHRRLRPWRGLTGWGRWGGRGPAMDPMEAMGALGDFGRIRIGHGVATRELQFPHAHLYLQAPREIEAAETGNEGSSRNRWGESPADQRKYLTYGDGKSKTGWKGKAKAKAKIKAKEWGGVWRGGSTSGPGKGSEPEPVPRLPAFPRIASGIGVATDKDGSKAQRNAHPGETRENAMSPSLRRARSTALDFYNISGQIWTPSQHDTSDEPGEHAIAEDVRERRYAKEEARADVQRSRMHAMPELHSEQLMDRGRQADESLEEEPYDPPKPEHRASKRQDSSGSPDTAPRSLARLTRGITRQIQNAFGLEGDGIGGRGIVLYPQDTHTATVIFLHGLGDSAKTWSTSLVCFGLRHVKYVMPTASYQVAKAAMGIPMRAWFNIVGNSGEKGMYADDEDLFASVRRIEELIRVELDLGIPPNRILLGGFSQGAAIALSALLASPRPVVGGVFALSGWLPLSKHSKLLSRDFRGSHETPILMIAGTEDVLVPQVATRDTVRMLVSLGFNDVRLHNVRDVGHDVNDQVLSLLNLFLAKLLPLEYER